MPEWKVAKNTTMFANEVIPRIRARLSGGAGIADPGLAAAAVT